MLANNTDILRVDRDEQTALDSSECSRERRGRMNWVVVGLGGLLIAIGFVIVVGPRNLPSSVIGPQAPFAEVDFDGPVTE